MTKNYLNLFALAAITMIGLVSFAQTATTPVAPGTTQAAQDPYEVDRVRCETNAELESDEAKKTKKLADCQAIYEKRASGRSRGNGGNSCDQLKSKYREANDEVGAACASLGVGSGPNSQRAYSAACEREMAAISGCLAQYGGKKANTGDLLSQITDVKGDCGWMLVARQESLEKREDKLQSNFDKYDDRRRENEEKFFDNEKDLLEKTNDLQDQIEEAQAEADKSQLDLQDALEDLKATHGGEVAKITEKLQELQNREKALVETGVQFLQSEFESTKKLLDYKCIEKGNERIRDLVARKAAKKSGNQWKFGSASELLGKGVRWEEYIQKLGTEVYSKCTGSDQDYVLGVQAAADKLKAQTSQHEFDLSIVRQQITAISQQLQTLEGNKKSAEQRALARADQVWRRAQNKLMMLQAQYQTTLKQASDQQQRLSQEIAKDQQLAAAEYQKLTSAQKQLETIANSGYDKKQADAKQEKTADASKALQKREQVYKDAKDEGCCDDANKASNKSICRSESSGASPSQRGDGSL